MRALLAEPINHRIMKATTIIGGATIILVAGALVGTIVNGPEGCAAQAAVTVFDPFEAGRGAMVQEPWLDPSVFFSDKAYVVSAIASRTDEGAANASFIGGDDRLVAHLKERIVPHVIAGIGWLKPPVVHFVVDEQGAATKVELVATSGNQELDAVLLRAVSGMPRWKPAQNAEGRAVPQAFEFKVVQAACGQQATAIPTLKVSKYDVLLSDRAAAMDHPYDIEFEVKQAGPNTYTLITTMKLHGGSFYVSPNARRDFKGKFHVEVANHDHVVLEDGFTETPRSMEVVDPHPFIDGTVNWVNVDTRYEHTLTVTSADDFEIGGKYRFTIEPKCKLEEVPFMIKQRAGVLTIEKWKC